MACVWALSQLRATCTEWPQSPMRQVHRLGSLARGQSSSYILFLVLTGGVPYSWCDDATALSDIRAGKTPQRLPDGIGDPVRQFLEKCWSRNPRKRPPAAEVYRAFSDFRSIRSKVEELPGKLRLQVLSLKIAIIMSKRQQFFVKFRYGKMDHTTSLTTRVPAGDEYTWFPPRPPPPSLLPLTLR